MRPIDSENVIAWLNAQIEKVRGGWLHDYGFPTNVIVALTDVKRFVKNLPTIEAEPVNRWIPVEDALPEIGYNVLVTRQTESNARYTRIASRQDDCWMDSTDEYGKPNPHQVIAWMPMPDAYEPPEKE